MKGEFSLIDVKTMADLLTAACWEEVIESNDEIHNYLSKIAAPNMFTEESGLRIRTQFICYEDNPVGYLESNYVPGNPKFLYIRQLTIKPEERGKGYAKKIINALMHECTLVTVRRIELQPTPKSMPFWLKLGFEPCREKHLFITF